MSLSFCSQWVLVQGPGPTPSVQGPSSSQSHYLSFRTLVSALIQGPDPFPFYRLPLYRTSLSVQGLVPDPPLVRTGPCPQLSRHVQTCSSWTTLYRQTPSMFKLVQLGLGPSLYRDTPNSSPWTYSNLFTMKQRLSASRRLAFHWNTFLLIIAKNLIALINRCRYPAFSEISIILNLLGQKILFHQHFTYALQLMQLMLIQLVIIIFKFQKIIFWMAHKNNVFRWFQITPADKLAGNFSSVI